MASSRPANCVLELCHRRDAHHSRFRYCLRDSLARCHLAARVTRECMSPCGDSSVSITTGFIWSCSGDLFSARRRPARCRCRAAAFSHATASCRTSTSGTRRAGVRAFSGARRRPAGARSARVRVLQGRLENHTNRLGHALNNYCVDRGRAARRCGSRRVAPSANCPTTGALYGH
jgi:hypothetical protein